MNACKIRKIKIPSPDLDFSFTEIIISYADIAICFEMENK